MPASRGGVYIKLIRVPIRDDIDSKYGKLLRQHKLLIADVDLSQREIEVNEMIRKLFR